MVPLEVVGAFFIVLGAVLAFLLTLYFVKCALVCLLVSSGRGRAPERATYFLVPVYLALILGLSIFASLPAFDKAAGSLHTVINWESLAPYSPALHEQFRGLTIVTFSSDGYTDALENAIGSFHVWAKGVPIAVYDMGLSAASVTRIRRLAHVQIIPFNFSQYPTHVRYMHNYAFKPLLMLDAVQRFGSILSLDAGIELRQSPRHVFEAIYTVGYFFVEASNADPLSRVNPATVKYLGMPAPSPQERQCYAGMQGYKRGDIVEHVLRPAVACALDPACIDPPGSGHENHRYEQVVLSLFMRKHRIHCHVGRLYNEHLPTTLHPDPLALHQPQLFFFRRWRYPKPYMTLALPLGSGGGGDGAGEGTMGDGESELEEKTASGLFENGVTDRKTSDVAFVRCLQEHGYDTVQCDAIQADWQAAAAGRKHLGSSEYRAEQERNGWALAQAARVYWAWPLSLHEAMAVVVLGGAAYVCWLCRPQSPAVPLLLVGVVVTFTLLRINTPRLCMPGHHVSFSSLETRDPFLMSGLTRLQCPGVSLTATPHFVRAGAQHYMFFSTSAYEHSIVTYAVASDIRGATWIVKGTALVSPVPLSRPCVFMRNHTFFMLPVVASSNRVQLFVARNFPTGWHVVRDLITFHEPTTTMLYELQGKWYLLATTDSGITTHLFEARHLLGPYRLAARAPVLTPAAAVCRAPVALGDDGSV